MSCMDNVTVEYLKYGEEKPIENWDGAKDIDEDSMELPFY